MCNLALFFSSTIMSDHLFSLYIFIEIKIEQVYGKHHDPGLWYTSLGLKSACLTVVIDCTHIHVRIHTNYLNGPTLKSFISPIKTQL